MNLIFPRIVTGLAALFASVLITAWFVHAGIHVTEVIEPNSKDAHNSAALTRLLF
jgi:hypothetical protein